MASKAPRDQHGKELPDQGGALSDAQVDQGLAALPGWEREGHDLVRRIPVPQDSRDGLREGVRHAVPDQSRVAFDDSGEKLSIVLGRGPGGLQPADLEAAARIDAVLSGSGRDTGEV